MEPLRGASSSSGSSTSASSSSASSPSRGGRVGVRAASPGAFAEIVVVVAPLAAAQAAAMFLVGLTETFGLPLVLVMMGAAEDHADLCVRLQAHCALPLRQVDDKDPIVSGRIHLAPAGYHVLVERGGFVLSTEGPVNGARPSIDVLLESVADAFGEGVVCVLLGGATTEAGVADGRAGAARIRATGGLVIVQNPMTALTGQLAASPPLAAVPSAAVLHLSEIAPFVTRLGDREAT